MWNGLQQSILFGLIWVDRSWEPGLKFAQISSPMVFGILDTENQLRKTCHFETQIFSQADSILFQIHLGRIKKTSLGDGWWWIFPSLLHTYLLHESWVNQIICLFWTHKYPPRIFGNVDIASIKPIKPRLQGRVGSGVKVPSNVTESSHWMPIKTGFEVKRYNNKKTMICFL